MVRLATSNSERRAKRPSNPAVSLFADESQLKELRFTLAHKLQSSLDLNNTLKVFFTSVQEFISISGLVYHVEQTAEEIRLGKASQHTVSYNLSTDDLKLGSIVFSREKRFSETELAVLEMFIGVLFYPLRNAILYQQAVESSMRDSLTGIGNRSALEASFSRELKLAQRHDQPLSLLLIDIDHFKKVNDSVGHRNGDRTLQHIVASVKSTLRETDQVFRYGGEEFVAVLQNTGPVDAKLIAERIRVNVARSPISLDSENLSCTVSIGIGVSNGVDNTEELFEKADTALYHAKNSGRNRVEVWSSHQVYRTGEDRQLA